MFDQVGPNKGGLGGGGGRALMQGPRGAETKKLLQSQCICTMPPNASSFLSVQDRPGYYRRTIYLVRHAESTWNAQEKKDSEGEDYSAKKAWDLRDSPLSPRGAMEAVMLGRIGRADGDAQSGGVFARAASAIGSGSKDDGATTPTPFFAPDQAPSLVLTSPLTRTILTGALAFHGFPLPPPASRQGKVGEIEDTGQVKIVQWKNLRGHADMPSRPVAPTHRQPHVVHESLYDFRLLPQRYDDGSRWGKNDGKAAPAAEGTKKSSSADADEPVLERDDQLGLPITMDLVTARKLLAVVDFGHAEAGGGFFSSSSTPGSLAQLATEITTNSDVTPGFACDPLKGDFAEPEVCARLPASERCRGFRALRKMSPMWPMCSFPSAQAAETQEEFATRIRDAFLELITHPIEDAALEDGKDPNSESSGAPPFGDTTTPTKKKKAAETEKKRQQAKRLHGDGVIEVTWEAPSSIMAAVKSKEVTPDVRAAVQQATRRLEKEERETKDKDGDGKGGKGSREDEKDEPAEQIPATTLETLRSHHVRRLIADNDKARGTPDPGGEQKWGSFASSFISGASVNLDSDSSFISASSEDGDASANPTAPSTSVATTTGGPGKELPAVALVTHGAVLEQIRKLKPFQHLNTLPAATYPIDLFATDQTGLRPMKKRFRFPCGIEPGTILKLTLEWPMAGTHGDGLPRKPAGKKKRSSHVEEMFRMSNYKGASSAVPGARPGENLTEAQERGLDSLDKANLLAAQVMCVHADPDVERCLNTRKPLEDWCATCSPQIQAKVGMASACRR
eukprot:g8820.t1